MLNQIEDKALKESMIAMTCQEWAETNDPGKGEFYQAIIDLIKLGMVSAYYDDEAGCMKYSNNSGE